MIRLIVVCEGPTEQEFCNVVLSRHSRIVLMIVR